MHETTHDAGAEAFAVPGFDAIARMAAQALQVPLVSLVLGNGSTYWYAAQDGAGGHVPHARHPLYLEAARRGTPQLVLDTHGDERFDEHPLAASPAAPPLRFFASEPVFTVSGRQMGALCVMDYAPRRGIDAAQTAALHDAAVLAGTGIALRSYMGRTDPVTQLPHRNAFFEDLRMRISTDRGRVPLVAIEVAPVARFNAFLRAMGHSYADALMRAVAGRIRDWAGPDTRIYQVGATRFAVLPDERSALDDAPRFDDLVTRLRQPFDCLGIPLTIQPGVGLLDLDARELDGGDPLRLVMSASHMAQHTVRGWAHYQRSDDERQREDFFLVTELAAALTERAELDLYYQPRIDLRSGRCVAVEALARWQHPTLGAIRPEHFIALAESAGLTRTLTSWVLEHGVTQLAQWRNGGLDIALSLNVSGVDFESDLVTRVEAAMQRHHVDGRALELEFTETTLMQYSDRTCQHLAAIRGLGVGIAIDDFGTGYSNLAYLRQVPATSLKIDQSFVRGMDANPQDATIVRAIAELGHDLGFRVVAEGVETRDIYDTVQGMACDEAQGFYLAAPMPAPELPRWLGQQDASPAHPL